MSIAVEVAYAAPGIEALVPLVLPLGATVADAVAASGLCTRFTLPIGTIAFAIHGQRADEDVPLADGDRVEITRPLLIDPKQVRRTRAADGPLSTRAAKTKPRTTG